MSDAIRGNSLEVTARSRRSTAGVISRRFDDFVVESRLTPHLGGASNDNQVHINQTAANALLEDKDEDAGDEEATHNEEGESQQVVLENVPVQQRQDHVNDQAIHHLNLDIALDNTGNAARIEWGKLIGLPAICTSLEEAHTRITTWRSNFFDLPKNAAGRDMIKEATRIMKLYNNNTVWAPAALHMLFIYFPLMMQKPAAKSNFHGK